MEKGGDEEKQGRRKKWLVGSKNITKESVTRKNERQQDATDKRQVKEPHVEKYKNLTLTSTRTSR